MTPEQLEQIIAGGETLDVEWKGERTAPLADAELVAAVACMANRAGNRPGFVLVGVEDDGEVTGARPRATHGEIDPAVVLALIANNSGAPT
jgi:ATP-dependent DNA helicase RecG